MSVGLHPKKKKKVLQVRMRTKPNVKPDTDLSQLLTLLNISGEMV